jgi:hypothetical protein
MRNYYGHMHVSLAQPHGNACLVGHVADRRRTATGAVAKSTVPPTSTKLRIAAEDALTKAQ